jgi:signal transduction histidine kinase
MYNLLSNAAKFTPEGGTIRVSAKRVRNGAPQVPGAWRGDGKEFVEISVTDTGIGVKSENLERIFKTFEQIENSVSRKYQGTGLGLSLSRSLVELHGGTIWAESEGEGKGAVFRFTLPLKN